MSDLPDGVTSEVMRWAIAWRIVEAAISSGIGGRGGEEKINILKEKTRDVYHYLSEPQLMSVVNNPLNT